MSQKSKLGSYTFQMLDDGEKPSGGGYFFNSSDFILNRKYPGPVYHFELLTRKMNLAARISIVLIQHKAFSPWKAPFGSLECLKDINGRILRLFLKKILKKMASMGMKSLEIVHYPEFYNGEATRLFDHAFQANDFTRHKDETNQFIKVKKDFDKRISYSERKRLNKCIRSGFHAALDNTGSLVEAYDLLVSSRRRKGYPVTMTYAELEGMFHKHPSRYLLFSVRDKDKMIAMAITILISKNIVYNFYHSDHTDYLKFSPTVMAVKTVFDYCKENDIKYIDLGISSLDGELNQGIYRFKKGLGARECPKRGYTWKMN